MLPSTSRSMFFLRGMLSALLRINEERIILGDRKRVLCRMPRAHLDLLIHVNLRRVFLLCRGSAIGRVVRDDLLALVRPIVAHIFTALIHELHVNLAIGLILDIDNMHVRIISASEHHVGAG